MAFSIRLSDEERILAENYTKRHSMTLGKAFKKALFDRIEEEYDIKIANEDYDDYIKSRINSTPINEFLKELDDNL